MIFSQHLLNKGLMVCNNFASDFGCYVSSFARTKQCDVGIMRQLLANSRHLPSAHHQFSHWTHDRRQLVGCRNDKAVFIYQIDKLWQRKKTLSDARSNIHMHDMTKATTQKLLNEIHFPNWLIFHYLPIFCLCAKKDVVIEAPPQMF